MNFIAVDDEELTLKGMERIIQQAVPDCALCCFGAPEDALEYAGENRVDIAFLDIEMGGMNGLELAKALKDVYGKTNIIFVTGYSQYAAESYEVNASGYLLKPITTSAVIDAIKRLRDPIVNISDESLEVKTKKKVQVQTFGNFEIFVDKKPLVFNRSKAKELFAYLVDRQGAFASTSEIAAVLWEDREYNRSLQSQIQVVIASMMKTLRDNDVVDVIIKEHNQIAVNKERIKCDYYDFIKWEMSAVNSYYGEYMSNYSWAEMTAGALDMRMQFN